MAYVCLNADECRIFVKNGKLCFQALKTGNNGEVIEQVTVSFPKEMAKYFTQIENLDRHAQARDDSGNGMLNRVKDYFRDH